MSAVAAVAADSVRDYASADAYLGGKLERPLEYATRIRRVGDSIAIRHHETDVVTYHPDGSLTLKNGGWFSRTTRERIEYRSGLQINRDWTHAYRGIHPETDGEVAQAYPLPTLSHGVRLDPGDVLEIVPVGRSLTMPSTGAGLAQGSRRVNGWGADSYVVHAWGIRRPHGSGWDLRMGTDPDGVGEYVGTFATLRDVKRAAWDKLRDEHEVPY